MSGLLYRIFHISKKRFIMTFCIMAGFDIMGVLVMLSADFGNISKLPAEELPKIKDTIYMLFLYPSALMGSFIMDSVCRTVKSDISTRWKSYAYTLPVKPVKYSGAFFIMFFLGFLVSAAAVMVHAVIISAVAHRELTVNSLKILMALLLMCLFAAMLKYLLLLLTRSEKAANAVLIAVPLAIYFAVESYFFYIIDQFDEKTAGLSDEAAKSIAFDAFLVEKFMDMKGFWEEVLHMLPFVLADLIILIFYLSVKRIERREK